MGFLGTLLTWSRFLLVHFHVEYLFQQTTTAKISAALSRLAGSSNKEQPLDCIYDRAMENVNRWGQSCRELALKIFSWLVKAQRTLTVDEIQFAVSVEQDRYELDKNDLPDRTTLLDVCGGLVIIDENSMAILLAQPSTTIY